MARSPQAGWAHCQLMSMTSGSLMTGGGPLAHHPSPLALNIRCIAY